MWMLKAFSLLAVAQAQIAPTQTMLRKAVLQKANSLLNSTVDHTLSCVSSCPLDGSSLSLEPKPALPPEQLHFDFGQVLVLIGLPQRSHV